MTAVVEVSVTMQVPFVLENQKTGGFLIRGAALDEQTFTQMLCLERKRTERSGRPFALMLVGSGEIGGDDTLGPVMGILLQSTRETDVKGWYKQQTVAGVIFTEIGDGSELVKPEELRRRVEDALLARFPIEIVKKLDISFRVYPDRSPQAGTPGGPDLTLYPDETATATRKPVAKAIKRGMDILGSSLAICLSAPLAAAIAFAIKATSPGPVLFRQERVGLYGQRFTFLKFRSMQAGSSAELHKQYVAELIAGRGATTRENGTKRTVYKITDDPRVTRVGRFLRRTSLDELPQLLNVLRGEMSLVGPRPPIPYEYECYCQWHRRRVLTVKPGITGLWQVNGRSRVNFDEMVRLDLRYAANWSLGLDLEILCRTPGAVVSGDGAY